MSEPNLQDWVGREERQEALIDPTRAQAMQATLDDASAPLRAGDALPPLWHWLYFWDLARTGELGHEGHAKLGGFLPPVPLPRRMWAGSRLSFPRPLAIGGQVARTSRIASVVEKQGRSGPLCFVTVRHSLEDENGPVIEEEHDIVYRAAPRAGETPGGPVAAAPGEAAWRQDLAPDPVLLFRYSALTFNGHRIHYDRDFCREVEGYPDLVVHGPLLATLMANQARRHCPDRRVTAFAFRAKAPLFAGRTIGVCGQPGQDGQTSVWVADQDGGLAMDGEMTLTL